MRLTVFLFLPLTCIMSVITACGWGCGGGGNCWIRLTVFRVSPPDVFNECLHC